MLNTNSTTVSEVFCCGECHAPVAMEVICGDILIYACQNERCQKNVSVDCPEALAVIEDVAIELPAPVPSDQINAALAMDGWRLAEEGEQGQYVQTRYGRLHVTERKTAKRSRRLADPDLRRARRIMQALEA